MAILDLRNALKGILAAKSSEEEPITATNVDDCLARETFTWTKDSADATAGVVTTAFPFVTLPTNFKVDAITWCQLGATTGGGNSATITVTSSDGAGSTKLTIGTVTTSTGNGFAADTKKSLTLTSTNQKVASGRVLHIAITKTSSGNEVTRGTLTISGVKY